MPLLIHDLGFVDLRPGSQQQQDALPPPPPYHYEQYNEDTPSHEFRTYIQEGKLEEAEQLFAKSMAEDPPVNLATKSHWHGSTPLFEAARSGNLAVAKWLVSKGAEADQANDWGDTPVNEAASMGHWDVVWYLADGGANLTRAMESNPHSSLVLSAVRHRSTEALEQLRKRGVDLGARHWNGNTVMRSAARSDTSSVPSPDRIACSCSPTSASNDR